MKKLQIFKNALRSISSQILGGKFRFFISFFSHYIFKGIGMKNPIAFPAAKFRLRNIVLNTRANTIDFWPCLESYEPDIPYFLLDVLKDKKGTFVDVGGHIGRYTVLMAKNEWKVITFEPMKSSYQMILKNLEENQCSENAKVYNLGLGIKNETLTIYYNSEETAESSLVMNEDKKNKEDIEIVSFDSFIDYKDFDELCFVKIDIEGNEENALMGMLEFIKEKKPILMLELWEYNQQKVTDILKSFGYKRLHVFWFIEEKHKEYMDKMYQFYNSHGLVYDYK